MLLEKPFSLPSRGSSKRKIIDIVNQAKGGVLIVDEVYTPRVRITNDQRPVLMISLAISIKWEKMQQTLKRPSKMMGEDEKRKWTYE